jgi:hypothetical protein
MPVVFRKEAESELTDDWLRLRFSNSVGPGNTRRNFLSQRCQAELQGFLKGPDVRGRDGGLVRRSSGGRVGVVDAGAEFFDRLVVLAELLQDFVEDGLEDFFFHSL